MQASHHDTSTQAMTEVALGLSMAFFSLLILALFSIGLPEQALQPESQQQSQTVMSKTEQLKLAANQAQASSNKFSDKKTAGDLQQYAFYFNGHFYDQQLEPLNLDDLASFSSQKPLILAVPASLPMLQVMAIRKQINHPNLSLTLLNKDWQSQLEQMQ